ncbi:MAG: hypothetical protein AAFO81_05065 [Pseudomonadota bacterium]
MSDPDQFKELEAMVTDYVNGRLDASNVQRFEAAMEHDEILHETVAFEREIKSVIATDRTAETQLPRFASLETKLDTRSRSSWLAGLRWGAPVAAAVMLAVVIGINWQQPVVHDDYQTLTDPVAPYSQPVLRIVLLEPLSAAQQTAFIEQFDVQVIAEYRSANTIDVVADTDVNFAALADTLRQDARIRLVRVLNESPE